MIFSFSRLNLYVTCPYRFYLVYVLERGQPDTLPLAFGKAIHVAIEAVLKGSTYEEACIQGAAAVDFFPGVKLTDLLRLLRNVDFSNYAGEYTEYHFELPLSDAPGAPRLQGYIDLVQPAMGYTHIREGGYAEIVDWKSNWQTYPVLRTKQLGLYAWAAAKLWRLEHIRGTLYFLRYRKPLSHVFTAHERDEAAKWALQVANEIELRIEVVTAFKEMAEELFRPKSSKECRHCPFAAECSSKFPNAV